MNLFLIVEDEPAASRALSTMLALEGLGRCDVAHSATEARQAIRSKNYEIIFLDINLPEPLGEELLAECLELNPTQAVVMVTGLNEAAVAVRCLQHGARDFITKPCHPERVKEAVARARQPVRTLLVPGQQLPTVDDVTDVVIQAAMERCEGNLTQAARLIGMSRSGLAKRLDRKQS